jgi:hypothetical protein
MCCCSEWILDLDPEAEIMVVVDAQLQVEKREG